MANQIDTDSKIIAADQFGFGQPALCRCSDILMFTAHINDSSQLEIHKSVNNGINWSLVKTFSETDPGDFEMVSIDSTSAAIVFMYTGNDYKIYVTSNSGSTWIQKHTISGTYCEKANLAYDSIENRLWLSSRDDTTTYLAYSDNKGDNWTNTYHAFGTSGDQVVDMDINPTNSKPYIIIAGSGSVEAKRYIFSKTGDYESVDSLGTSYFHDTCIIVDSNSNDFIITGYKHSDNKYYIAYAKNGVLDTSNFLLGSGAESNYSDLIIPGSLSAAVDGDDNIYAFYTKKSNEKTYYRKYTGSTWESEVELIAIANDRISTEKRPISGSDKLHYVYYTAP